MENQRVLKIGYELMIILNGLSIILWIFLAIFPGVAYINQGNVLEGFGTIFWDIWFLCFMITLLLGIIFKKLLRSKSD